MKKLRALFIILLFFSLNAFTQSNGDYRTNTSSTNWDNSVWEKYVGGSWDNNGGAYYPGPDPIPTGVQVTINHDIQIHTLGGTGNVTNNGTIILSTDQVLIVGFSFGTTSYPGSITGSGDLEWSGVLYLDPVGSISIGAGGTIKENSGSLYAGIFSNLTVNGTYDRAINGGSMPSGIVWSATSVLRLSGLTNTLPAFATDTYNDLEITSSGMTSDLTLSTGDMAKFTNINISNTGSYAIKTDPGVLSTISGNLTIGTNGQLEIGATDKLTVNGTLSNNATAADLVINSNSSGTGSLISNSSEVNASFNQYIGNSRWYLITPPFSGIDTYDFWDNTNDAYMQPYNSPGDGWGDYYTSPAIGLNVGQGYKLWETANFTFSETGTLITGNQALALSSGGTIHPDWNLLGNPYPCAIDWTQVADKSNCDGSAFYVYDGSGYKYHNGTTGTATNSKIPAMQGFFVKHIAGSSITIEDNDKAHAGIGIYKNSDEADYSNHFKIEAAFEEQESVCVIYQHNDASNSEDAEFDAPVFFNDHPDFIEVYSLAGEKASCINIHNEYPYSVNLGFKVPDDNSEITIRPIDIRHSDSTFSIFLEDQKKGINFDFIENPVYTINFDKGGIIEDRIVLHLNSTLGFSDPNTEDHVIYSNGGKVYLDLQNLDSYQLRIFNMIGQLVYNEHVSHEGFKSIQLNQPSAYYLIRVISNDKTITKKLFISD